MDFAAIEDVAIPGVIYGPIGRNYHQYIERVNRESLLKVVPGRDQGSYRIYVDAVTKIEGNAPL